MRKIEGQSEIAMPNRFGDPVVKTRRNSVPSSPLERYLFVRPLVFVGRIEQVDERLDDRIGTQG